MSLRLNISHLKRDDSIVHEVLTGLHRYNLMCRADDEENQDTELCHPRVVRVAQGRKYELMLH
jgi:hypothetical protein